MSTAFFNYNKQQFNADVSLNGATALTGKAQFNADVSLNGTTTQFNCSNVLVLNGGVAIGKSTITSGVKLDVSGGSISLSNPSPSIVLKPGGGTWWGIQAPIAGGLNIGSVNGSELMTAPSMTLLNNGNVGIGTSSPGYKLDVAGGELRVGSASSYIIHLGNSGAGTYRSAYISGDGTNMEINNQQNGRLVLSTNNSEKMRITADGNVGIGTTNPSQKLGVSGNCHISGQCIIGATDNANNYALKVTNGGSLIDGGLTINTGLTVNGGSAFYEEILVYNKSVSVTNSSTYQTVGLNIVNTSISGTNGFQFSLAGNAGWGGVKNSFGMYSMKTGSHAFIVNGDNGRVSIGTYNSLYPLAVHGNYGATGTIGTARYFGGNDGTIQSTNSHSNSDINIYAPGWIFCGGYIAASDRRIKTNIVDIDDTHALNILRQIKPKTYGYVDKFKRGDGSVIGFIAQEIKEIIPKAVNVVKENVPNFYTSCHISLTDTSNIVLVTSQLDLSWNPLHDASGNAFVDSDGNACSDASGNKVFKVKLYDQQNNEIECKTTNVLDKRSFLIDITGSKLVDASGNLHLETDGGYFLYGQEVDDFHTIDKNAIFTVVTAAVQDIDRKQLLDEEKIAALEGEVSSLQSENASLQSQLSALQSQMAAVLLKLNM